MFVPRSIVSFPAFSLRKTTLNQIADRLFDSEDLRSVPIFACGIHLCNTLLGSNVGNNAQSHTNALEVQRLFLEWFSSGTDYWFSRDLQSTIPRDYYFNSL